MNELNREARAILKLGRQADGLAPPDKERIRNKLAQRLGVGLAAGSLISAGTMAAEAASSSSFVTIFAGATLTSKILAVVAIVGAAGAAGAGIAGLTLERESQPHRASAQRVVEGPRVAAKFAASGETAPSSSIGQGLSEHVANSGKSAFAEPAWREAPRHPNSLPPGRSNEATSEPSVDRDALTQTKNSAEGRQAITVAKTSEVPAPAVADLPRQVEALRRARTAIHQGDGAAALDAVDEGVPLGGESSLEEELVYARVLALCQIGRVAEARQQADDFASRFPESPLRSRVLQSCAYGFGRFAD